MAIDGILVLPVFDKDLKNLRKRHRKLAPLWKAVDAIVAEDYDLLRSKYRDHSLTGQWAGFRELHVEGDWLLIYTIDAGELLLVLTRTGSHDELYSSRTSAKDIRSYRNAQGRILGE
ncbi:type II toxin-antitoxin system YafQ family toxin [Bifidobacterium felsineum]|uniref:type II toxin-antitoxin system RelE/ParE family toxin n=1 Tax=Bifidobacterium felsineum TaxID=2045440 RepID=UPI001BDCB121|nr:type II toxin-antitoxin system YafQ family toxin [Bifidobacterium felsineum]MBT1164463.1 type II toxin-antitoxin system YafQ family toxin [Bifidobacterium felsineum]